MQSTGFGAFARKDARLLILGSLPGQESLRRGEYYAQLHNAFWKIMGELYGAAPALPYAERMERLMKQGIALWDVCASAWRPGSLDSAIQDIVPNDFAAFFEDHPAITHIYFNGAKAADIYRRKVLPGLSARHQSIASTTLPSTSPAHARLCFEQKLARWREGLLQQEYF